MIIKTEDPDCLWATNARKSGKWEEIERGVFKLIELGGEE
jgi:hypothetical protein